MSPLATSRISALTRFGINSPDTRQLARFYHQALGAQVGPRERQGSHRFADWSEVQGGAEATVLRLGEATVELLEFDHPGHPCPPELSPYDTRFQHLGIVVADMHRAMQRLSQVSGWTLISTAGPQQLPANDGGVTAFKFKDPDGHPLEFLQFGAGAIPDHWRGRAAGDMPLGIDHSAISVADTNRSVHFYESMGLTVTGRTLNRGMEQERLDGVPSPRVDVISLAPQVPTPHVELLHYQTASRPPHAALRGHDSAAFRLIFTASVVTSHETNRVIQDPDGHFLQIG